MKRLNQDEKNKALELYHQGLYQKDIAIILNVSPSTIHKALFDSGLKLPNDKSWCRKYKLNDEYFDNIDTQEKAYWLGFILADGNISNNSLSIELSKKDRHHLELMLKALDSDSPIKDTRKNCCRVFINSKKLVQSLRKYGIVPNKTKTTYFPDIPVDLHRHFVRGILDGDGWVVCRKNSSNSIKCEFGFSSGSREFVYSLRDVICHLFGRKRGHLFRRKTWNGSCYQLIFGGTRIFNAIKEWMYKDATVFLKRKFEKTLVKNG